MKSLKDRQIDRLQRKVDNAAFSEAAEVTGRVGLAAVRIGEAQEAFAALSDDERKELAEGLESGFADGFNDETNLYGADGQLKSAGVGIVNPMIVPPTGIDASEQASGVAASGWAEPPAPSVDPAKGNAAGVALDAQTADADKPAETGKNAKQAAK